MSTKSAKPMQAQAAQPGSLSSTALLQRKCACGNHTLGGGQCEECGRKRLQRRTTSDAKVDEAPSIVNEVLNSPGQPLDAGTRAFFEPRFGLDFSRVRVHTDSRAAESAQAVNALAFTVGQSVVFGANQYAPASEHGRRLIAHELTHVAQQHNHSTAFQRRLIVGSADDVYEREADRFAERIMATSDGAIGGLSSAQGMMLQRKCPGPEGGCVGGQWKFEYDGCSGPSGLFGAMVNVAIDKNNPAGGENTQFATCLPSSEGGRACDRHDECYQTCHHGDKTAQSACDVQMLEDMLAACSNSENDDEEGRCSLWAKRYYTILRSVGRVAYGMRQKQVCGCEDKSKSVESHSSTSEAPAQEGK